MKGQFDFTINDKNYALNNFISEWYDVSSYDNFEFIVFCSVGCDQVVEYSIDKNYEIIETLTYNLSGGTTNNLNLQVVTRYVRFSVKNISSNPCYLSSQAFYESQC